VNKNVIPAFLSYNSNKFPTKEAIEEFNANNRISSKRGQDEESKYG
jgi:hypothetical protein